MTLTQITRNKLTNSTDTSTALQWNIQQWT